MTDPIGLDIRAMKKTAEKLQPYRRGDCPICAWPLAVSADDILHCLFCGWTDQLPIKRDIFNDG